MTPTKETVSELADTIAGRIYAECGFASSHLKGLLVEELSSALSRHPDLSKVREILKQIMNNTGGMEWPPTNSWRDQIIVDCNHRATEALAILEGEE